MEINRIIAESGEAEYKEKEIQCDEGLLYQLLNVKFEMARPGKDFFDAKQNTNIKH